MNCEEADELKALRAEIVRLELRLNELKATVESKFDAYDKSIDRFYTDRFNPLENKVDELRELAAENGVHIRGLIQVQKSHDERIGKQEKLSARAIGIIGFIVFITSTAGAWIPKLFGGE
jgi:uncharacterized protein YlxW (UPF0749 family)